MAFQLIKFTFIIWKFEIWYKYPNFKFVNRAAAFRNLVIWTAHSRARVSLADGRFLMSSVTPDPQREIEARREGARAGCMANSEKEDGYLTFASYSVHKT